MSVEARFLSHVDQTGDCWLWTGKTDSASYGSFWLEGRTRLAHRVSHELFIGPIPDGFEVDHVAARGCVHKHCVRPSHLEAVTRAENRRRRREAQTHCKRGHELNGLNIRIDKRGVRVCRACDREIYHRKQAA